jgi:shikimate dehydrogenase
MGDAGVTGTRLGVLGWPVGHSLSPVFQSSALEAAGLGGWRYMRLPVPPELFEEAVHALPAAGFRGVNVTIPHKQAALRLADMTTARARAIGAANTLVFGPEGGIEADNTDAPGLIASLPAAPAGWRAVILGAGGTARAAVWALLDAGAAEVLVWNRTSERAAALCADVGGTPLGAREPVPVGAELLVNCTSVGLGADDELEGLPVCAEALREYRAVVDFAYRRGGTALMRAARSRNVPAVGGLELLIAQGALSFELFTGRPAPVEVMREAVGLSSPPGPGGYGLAS